MKRAIEPDLAVLAGTKGKGPMKPQAAISKKTSVSLGIKRKEPSTPSVAGPSKKPTEKKLVIADYGSDSD